MYVCMNVCMSCMYVLRTTLYTPILQTTVVLRSTGTSDNIVANFNFKVSKC